MGKAVAPSINQLYNPKGPSTQEVDSWDLGNSTCSRESKLLGTWTLVRQVALHKVIGQLEALLDQGRPSSSFAYWCFLRNKES